MYAGALKPALLLVALYVSYIVVIAIVKPKWVPALPAEARIYREKSGASGHVSLIVLLVIAGLAGWFWSTIHDGYMTKWLERTMPSPADEIVILSLTVSSLLALVLAIVNRATGMGLLSRLAEQVTFVLIPPLVLMFLVLGTIFLGIATPTEGGAMGAMGALIMAVSRRRLNFKLLKQALDGTAKLATFVMFILVGSTVFSFTFNAADGHIWVEHLFTDMPGGALGFLIVVNLLVFVLGCFIDFFEIAFIVVPILVPVATKILPELMPGVPIDAVMIWFGIILAINLQTSFLTPPFGFALFYLRSVAAKADYLDRVTGATIPAVKTSQIYMGSIAFLFLQVIVLASVVTFPQMVVSGITKGPNIDAEAALEALRVPGPGKLAPLPSFGFPAAPEAGASAPASGASPPADAGAEADDPMKAILDAVKKDAEAKK